jgi:hypothetical protein
MKLICLIAFFALPFKAALADTIDLTPARWIPAGTYGGGGANFVVENHAANLDLPCAVGSIPHRPSLDNTGRFVIDGTYTSRMVSNPPPHALPATFFGRLLGNQLWLQVVVHERGPDRSFQYGPLTLGQNARFFRCL